MEVQKRELESLLRGKDSQTVALDVLEHEYVKTYEELIDTLDTLMEYETCRTTRDININREDVLHDYTGEGDVSSSANTLEYERGIQRIRKMVVETGHRTIPILRAVHQVDGIPQRESSLADMLDNRDQMFIEIIKLSNAVKKKQEELFTLERDNERLLAESTLLSKVPRSDKDDQNDETKDNSEMLRQELETAIDKSTRYAEQIQRIIFEEGLDWYNDKDLLDVVELCGSITQL